MLTEKKVAQKLLQINAIRINTKKPFLWASGLRSPIYCDNRYILSYPRIRTEIKNSLAEKARSFEPFNKIAGVATAGIAHGALVADALDLPFVYVRSSPKKHGAKNQIEGYIEEGDKCLVIEDLISTGGSSLKAVYALRNMGVRVSGVIAIFSYQFKKAEKDFEEADCVFSTLSNIDALLEALAQQKNRSSVDLSSLATWNQDPLEWSKLYIQQNND